MTETDFFRIARERMGDYSITINRISTIGGKPYKCALLLKGQVLSGEGDTLAECLSSIAARAGVDRRRAARPDGTPGPSLEDRKWPGA